MKAGDLLCRTFALSLQRRGGLDREGPSEDKMAFLPHLPFLPLQNTTAFLNPSLWGTMRACLSYRMQMHSVRENQDRKRGQMANCIRLTIFHRASLANVLCTTEFTVHHLLTAS